MPTPITLTGSTKTASSGSAGNTCDGATGTTWQTTTTGKETYSTDGSYARGVYYTIVNAARIYGHWVQVDLSTARAVDSYTVQNHTTLKYSPVDFMLVGSPDGQYWLPIDTRTGVTWSAVSTTLSFTVSAPARWRYLRLIVTRNSGGYYTEVNELTFTELTSAPANSATPPAASFNDARVAMTGVSATASGTETAGAYTPAAAVDGYLQVARGPNSYNTYWASPGQDGNELYYGGIYHGCVYTIIDEQQVYGQWLQLKLSSAVAICQYTLSNGVTPATDPVSFVLAGSNNTSYWSTIDTQTGIVYPSTLSSLMFTVSSPVRWTYLRVVITATASTVAVGCPVQIGELDLVEKLDAPVNLTSPTVAQPIYARVYCKGRPTAQSTHEVLLDSSYLFDGYTNQMGNPVSGYKTYWGSINTSNMKVTST
ncbi:hypothetical protein JKP88DRAFT_252192, partial [Tribonema minus]